MQCYILNMIAVSRIYPDTLPRMLREAVKIVASFVLCFALAHISAKFVSIHSLLALAFFLCCVGLIALAVVFGCILNKNERTKLLQLIK